LNEHAIQKQKQNKKTIKSKKQKQTNKLFGFLAFIDLQKWLESFEVSKFGKT